MAVKKISTVQWSNNIISDRNHKIWEYIEDKLINRLKSCNVFAIQLDEITAGLLILLVYVRYVFETATEKNVLLCILLDTNTTGKEIFKTVYNYMNKNQIDEK